MSNIMPSINANCFNNDAVIFLKKGYKSFEVSCFKDKFFSWRNNPERDFNEVLKTHTVFTCALEYQVATNDELFEGFGKIDVAEICQEILATGELQDSEKELKKIQLKGIAKGVVALCLDPFTRGSLSSSTIEQLLHSTHFSVNTNEDIKQQTMNAIKYLLEKKVPIKRTNLKIRISYPAKEAGGKMRDILSGMSLNVESEKWEDGIETLCLHIYGGSEYVFESVVLDSTGECTIEILDETFDEALKNVNVLKF